MFDVKLNLVGCLNQDDLYLSKYIQGTIEPDPIGPYPWRQAPEKVPEYFNFGFSEL